MMKTLLMVPNDGNVKRRRRRRRRRPVVVATEQQGLVLLGYPVPALSARSVKLQKCVDTRVAEKSPKGGRYDGGGSVYQSSARLL